MMGGVCTDMIWIFIGLSSFVILTKELVLEQWHDEQRSPLSRPDTQVMGNEMGNMIDPDMNLLY